MCGSKWHGLSFTVKKKWSSDFRLWVGEFATGYLYLMKIGDPWLLPPHYCWKGVHTYLMFWWHTLWQLGKSLNKQYTQQISYNISTNINKQTNNNIMQDHAKTKVYIWSLKSNTKLRPWHLQWSCHCERPPKLGVLLKKRFWYFLGHLSFWVSGVESSLTWLKKYKKKY